MNHIVDSELRTASWQGTADVAGVVTAMLLLATGGIVAAAAVSSAAAVAVAATVGIAGVAVAPKLHAIATDRDH